MNSARDTEQEVPAKIRVTKKGRTPKVLLNKKISQRIDERQAKKQEMKRNKRLQDRIQRKHYQASAGDVLLCSIVLTRWKTRQMLERTPSSRTSCRRPYWNFKFCAMTKAGVLLAKFHSKNSNRKNASIVFTYVKG